jgi:chemotaxis protein MotA
LSGGAVSSIIGIAGIIYGLYFVFTAPAEGFKGYYDLPGIVLLGLVPPSIMLLSHRVGDFVLGIKILFKSMFNNTARKQNSIIEALTRCSARVRAEGVGALIHERRNISYDLMIDGLSLIVNDFTLDEIRHNLHAKIGARQSQMQMASSLFENMSKVSPGVGMMGTLMGLIAMMSHMSDPAAIGSGMALAMITTLYGLMIGTIIYAPFGEKIALEAEKILEIDKLVLEGVLALKAKKSSVHLKDIMRTYGNQAPPTSKPPVKRGA